MEYLASSILSSLNILGQYKTLVYALHMEMRRAIGPTPTRLKRANENFQPIRKLLTVNHSMVAGPNAIRSSYDAQLNLSIQYIQDIIVEINSFERHFPTIPSNYYRELADIGDKATAKLDNILIMLGREREYLDREPFSPPGHVRFIESSRNSIKLAFNLPLLRRNAAPLGRYIINCRRMGTNWCQASVHPRIEKVDQFIGTVYDLEPNTHYQFKVAVVTNDGIMWGDMASEFIQTPK